MLSCSWRCSKSRSTRSRAGDASLWAMTFCRPNSAIVTCVRAGERVPGDASITSSSSPISTDARPFSAGGKLRTPTSRLRCSTSTPIWRLGTRRMSTCTRG